MLTVLDGSHGEGGGQIVRTALTLACVAGRPFRVEQIRANRPKSGLAPQHLAAIRSATKLCGATVNGATLGSQTVTFEPRHPVRSGEYTFDIASHARAGSAGSAPLLLQTLLIPLALAHGPSVITIRGGTHVRWAPAFDYLEQVWLPVLRRMGIDATAGLGAWGWYPAGGGEITCSTPGGAKLAAFDFIERGPLLCVTGRAVTANLPAHIAQRTADRARDLLSTLGVPDALEPVRVSSISAGAGIFLCAEYEHIAAGFMALGERGKPAERVAEEAVEAFFAHHQGGAAVDEHLADQLLIPMALAQGASAFTTAEATLHLHTNAWVIEQFGIATVTVEGQQAGSQLVTVTR